MQLSVVIPIKDECENLRPLHEALCAALDPLGQDYEIIFVDDGSTDGSFIELSRLARRDARVKAVQLRRNYGQTPALRAGIDFASGDVIVTMDGDLQNDPADIPMLLNELQEGYDVVLGWRKDRKDGFWLRRLPSLMANALIRKVTGVTTRDMGCTLRVMRREAAKELSLYGEMHRFINVLAQHDGWRVIQLPVQHHARKFGQTKYNLTRTVRVVLDLITVKFLHSYLARPMHVFGLGGLFFIFTGFLSLAICIVQRLWFQEHMNRNPLLLLSVMLVVIGVQFISMGLIGEVLSRTYYESQGKTSYLVRTTLNLKDDKGDSDAPRRKAA
jgi:glycosyltransferase involved in cell wall biosynthesis